MKCPACGNENAAEASYCGVCYEVLGRKPVSAPAPVSSPVPSAALPAAPPDFAWSYGAAAAGVAVFLAFAALGAERGERLFLVLDGVNLAFHEGGHIVFGLLGVRFIMVLGGTAMQLLLPAAAAAHFYRRGERVSACLMLFWLGENLLGVGKYIADARAQQLELVAGGVHDWTYLLETVGLLTHDVGLGRAVVVLGRLIMGFSAAAAVAAWRAQPPRR